MKFNDRFFTKYKEYIREFTSKDFETSMDTWNVVIDSDDLDLGF